MNNLILQPAAMADLPLIMQFITEARQHLKDQKIDQWQDGYPNDASIVADINAQKGFIAVLLEAGTQIKIGYLCIDFGGEPAYDKLIGGNWQTESAYAVVHRMTIGDAYKGKGLASSVFSQAEAYCMAHNMPQLRIDTHPDNLKMQHLLEKNGFTRCGTVFYDSGERVAYDKIIR